MLQLRRVMGGLVPALSARVIRSPGSDATQGKEAKYPPPANVAGRGRPWTVQGVRVYDFDMGLCGEMGSVAFVQALQRQAAPQ